MFDTATDYGIGHEEYWHKTIGEIKLYIEQQKKHNEVDYKSKLLDLDFLSNRIIGGVAYIMGSGDKPKTIFDLYPDLFAEDKKYHDQQQQEKNLQEHKQFMNSLAKKERG